MMYPMKLAPVYKDYLWGGHELERLYGKAGEGACTAESWELCSLPEGKSVIRNGQYKGQFLGEILKLNPCFVSPKFGSGDRFPILIKSRYILRMTRRGTSSVRKERPRCGMSFQQSRTLFYIMG